MNKIRIIKKDVRILKEYKASVHNNELLKIEFDENLKNNYYKILMNIYHINLKKMQRNFRDEYVSKKYKFQNADHILNELDKLYEQSVKETR